MRRYPITLAMISRASSNSHSCGRNAISWQLFDICFIYATLDEQFRSHTYPLGLCNETSVAVTFSSCCGPWLLLSN